MRIRTAVFMTGLGFTFGLVFGLAIHAHLPVDSLPAGLQEGVGHERVRRSAQVGEQSGLQGSGAENGSPLHQRPARDPLGTVDKQSLQSDLAGDYYGGNSLDNDAGILQGKVSLHLNSINQFPNKNSESLVYVNPVENKLVLNNNRTELREPRKLQEGLVGSYPDSNVKADGDLSQDVNNNINLGSEDTRVTSGIYWSNSVEDRCPTGFSSADHDSWKTRATSEKFVKMEEGCGRMQNRLVTFYDAKKACARYRLNVDQIQGEIFSYYLSKLLNIHNVPPSTLHIADTRQDQWRLLHPEVAGAQWSEEKPLILSQWLPGLKPAYIPNEFRNQSKVFSVKSLQRPDLTDGQLCELLQWSDLIVFDYLTANLDRMVNNMFNMQWNDQMMSKPAHNLEKSSDGHLVFLDNESGLFHGFRLLDKYAPYHETLLKSLCVFRDSTIRALKRFIDSDSIGDELQRTFEENEPLHRLVPRLPQKNIKVLKQRMSSVYNQVQQCQSTYGR